MRRHIVCFGDSNTHGYCGDSSDCADGGDRFNEQERWPCLLAKALGEDCLVLEEGMSGRTTVFEDPFRECASGLDVLYAVLTTHEPVDLLIIMLGTNDTKERFGADAACIAAGMERLVEKAMTVPCWSSRPNILVIAPPHIREGVLYGQFREDMGQGCIGKSAGLAERYRELCERLGCAFLDAEGLAEFNRTDCMHLTGKGHAQLAKVLEKLVPELI